MLGTELREGNGAPLTVGFVVPIILLIVWIQTAQQHSSAREETNHMGATFSSWNTVSICQLRSRRLAPICTVALQSHLRGHFDLRSHFCLEESLFLYVGTRPTLQIMYPSFSTQKDHVKHWQNLLQTKSLMPCAWVFIFYAVNQMLLYWTQFLPRTKQIGVFAYLLTFKMLERKSFRNYQLYSAEEWGFSAPHTRKHRVIWALERGSNC